MLLLDASVADRSGQVRADFQRLSRNSFQVIDLE